jgi:hypothetical protein
MFSIEQFVMQFLYYFKMMLFWKFCEHFFLYSTIFNFLSAAGIEQYLTQCNLKVLHSIYFTLNTHCKCPVPAHARVCDDLINR